MGLRCVQNVQYVLKFCKFLVYLHVNKVNTACTELSYFKNARGWTVLRKTIKDKTDLTVLL